MDWLLLTIASAVLLGLYAPMMKHALAHEKSSQILALYPLVSIVILPFLVPIDYGLITTELGWLVFLKAVCVGITLFSANLALERLPITVYAPMRNLSPLFLLFLSFLLLGETIGLVQILGLLLIVTGAILLDVDVRKRHQIQQFKRFVTQPAILLLVLASFVISFAPIFDRLLLKKTDPYSLLFWYLLLLAAIFWTTHLIRERRLPFTHLEPKEWLWILSIGLMILLSDTLYFKAVQVPGTIIVVIIGIRRLSNLLSTIIGGKAFHEKDIAYKAAMCAVMIIGTVLLVL